MSGDSTRLPHLGRNFYLQKNMPAALLCLDHYFVNPPRIIVMKGQEVAEILWMFHAYARLLHDVAFDRDPCNNPSIQKLFGFQRSTENLFLVPRGTFLHGILIGYRSPIHRNDAESMLVSNWDLSQGFRRSLCDRLRRRVLEENEMCRKAQAFSPCLSFVVSGICNRTGCPQEHLRGTDLTLEWFNIRVRLHLQQILIFQTLHSIDIGLELPRQQGYA